MSADPRTTPTAIRAPHGARSFTITWADGKEHAIPHAILRGYCPCAGCQGHAGSIRYQAGGDLDLREVTRVGNYALKLAWGDAHDGGIYSFAHLRRLGELVAEHGPEGLERLGTLPRV